MRLIYNGVDITDDVDISAAVHRDHSDGRSDLLDITFEHAEAWYRWQPQENDTIEVTQDGYSTGRMHMNTILPVDGRYRILATGLKSRAQMRRWASYSGRTFADLVNVCAAECEMTGSLYGTTGNVRYAYMLRENESAPAFLHRIGRLEGTVLKAINGKLTCISVQAAQALEPAARLVISAQQPGVEYTRRRGTAHGTLTLVTPYGQTTATDAAAGHAAGIVLSNIPAPDIVTAGRWARNLLAMHNRNAEQLRVDSEFNAGFTAMARIDVSGGTDADGKWLIDNVEHDFILRRSRAELLRCTGTVV